MPETKKESKNFGCIGIAVFFAILWGIPSLISGKGFFAGILNNVEAGIYLAGIALVCFVIYKIFLEK